MELFRISDYYGFQKLQYSLSEYLRSTISIHNVCSLFTVARLHQQKKLIGDLLEFIETNAMDVLQSKEFLSLSPVLILF